MSIDGIRAVDKEPLAASDYLFGMSTVDGQRIGPRPVSTMAVAQQITALLPNGAVKSYASVSAMNADTTPAIGTLAYAEGKTYRKTAASGSAGWEIFLDFIPGTQVVRADVTGGTANAVEASSSTPISSTPGQQIINIGPFSADNGAGGMTLSINGESPRALVLNRTGAVPIPDGYIKEDTFMQAVRDSAGNYRLFSYGDATAVQAAAEAAQTAAVAAKIAAQEAALNASAYDPTLRYATPGLLFASTRAAAGEGTMWIGGNFAYREAASDATDHDFENAAGVKFYFDEPEADPLAFPPTIGTDDTANFAHALEYAEKITLDPRHDYKIHDMLPVARPVIIDLNRAKVSAAVGFTDDNLFKITNGDVQFLRGILDGTNLPDRTDDFVGADFKSFTLLLEGISGSPLSGVVFDGVTIKAGDTACIAAKYCPDIRLANVLFDGANTSATYSTEALAHLQYCDRLQASVLKLKSIKHKGVAFYSSNDFVATNIVAETIAAGEAAIFVASGSSRWTIGDVSVLGGFGAKADSCNYGTFRNFNVLGGGNALGGIMMQGCVETTADGGQINGFTQYGVSVCSHPLNATPAQDCNVLNMRIHGNGSYLDGSSGIEIAADTTYTNTGTTVRGNFIRSVDKGILSVDPGVASKIDNIDADGNRFYDCKSFAFYGPALSLDFCGNKVEDSTTLVHVVQTWSAGTGERLKVSNNEMYHVGTAAQGLFVHGDAANGKQASYNLVEFNGNMGSDGARALYASLQTNSDRIYQLTAVGNNWQGGADASAFYFDNHNTGVSPQVCVTGNSLLSSSYGKQNINFVQDAESGAFNGLTNGNMASVINAPNNI